MTERKKTAKVTLTFNIELDMGNYADVDDVTTFTEAASYEEDLYEENITDITDLLAQATEEPTLFITVVDTEE